MPISSESTRHPNGVLGVKSLTVVVRDDEEFSATRSQFEKLFATGGVQGDRSSVAFEIGRVHEVEGIKKGPEVLLRLPKDEGEEERTREKGFWYGDVVLAVKAGNGKEVGQKERLDVGEDNVGGLWVEYVE